MWKVELNISRSRKIDFRGGNCRNKVTVLVRWKIGIKPLNWVWLQLIRLSPRLLLFCKRSRNGCGRLLDTGTKGTMGRWKGKGSLFPPSHHPSHFPLPRILIGDWETSGDDSGFDPNTPILWRHLLLLFSLIFMHTLSNFLWVKNNFTVNIIMEL